MKTNTKFNAPWGTSLIIVSAIVTVILIASMFLSLFITARPDREILLIAPLAFLIGALFFMIRGYQLHAHHLLIFRLGWTSRIDLRNLISVEHDVTAMKGSIRTFGNGGFFSISGWFKNKKLGSYRAFVTNPKNAVILKTATKVYVISPQEPEKFVEIVKSEYF